MSAAPIVSGAMFAPVEASAGPGVATLTVEGSEVNGSPPGVVPVPNAVLLIDPAFRSACVTA